MSETAVNAPLITNDAVVFGILIAILAFVFKTSSLPHPFWKKFYTFFPSVLACYFIPAILNSAGIISGDSEHSNLYFVASRYLLPASLVLLTLSVDIPALKKLGAKPLIMFFSATIGIVIGGPVALLVATSLFPEIGSTDPTSPDAVWRGLSTIAGSWIGGGANQLAMKEVFDVGDSIFTSMLTVDIIVGNMWMAVLLYGAGMHKRLDARMNANAEAIDEVRQRVEDYRASIAKVPNLTDLSMVAAAGLGVTGIAHFGSDLIAPWIANNAPGLARYSLASGFFWLVVIATTGGLILSQTKARKLEGVGASRVGSLFIYILVATIGMKMDITKIFDHLEFFVIGFIWMGIHITILLVVARIIRAPFFFVAVGSQANVGGAASAPVVASAFHPSLAPVGALLAVLGYVVGSGGAWLCGLIMRAIAGG